MHLLASYLRLNDFVHLGYISIWGIHTPVHGHSAEKCHGHDFSKLIVTYFGAWKSIIYTYGQQNLHGAQFGSRIFISYHRVKVAAIFRIFPPQKQSIILILCKWL